MFLLVICHKKMDVHSSVFIYAIVFEVDSVWFAV